MTKMSNELDDINWSEFHTAYGVATKVPALLRQLGGSDVTIAKNAAHELWCGLCHQHAYVSSAAAPSYPILLKTLRSADVEIAVEILDILWGFAKCSAAKFGIGSNRREQWVVQLHDRMKADKIFFESLTASEDEHVRDFATRIVEELDNSD